MSGGILTIRLLFWTFKHERSLRGFQDFLQTRKFEEGTGNVCGYTLRIPDEKLTQYEEIYGIRHWRGGRAPAPRVPTRGAKKTEGVFA
ncbi:MAG: hypothetical protein A3G32_01155 [Deltaproteobacteria bacterium RIFCSPLOWO2_12_FULL_40_28]|nr:MAG: hypothetical protein A3C45_10040 [Deltaproteobacteria bacterium RIFCSPHIGHO2_02_FULL_40_28]OGQ19940.1 MAG: hypothetical protein A3E27_06990 [Deltaproteobacteria bacterium RIFCSPHIGHO2_12_FULL_40_32]OGQ52954.1 MAG: hypothetical protein A3G32_01155 [Deltaproteobacteria bacterium RIFCSPLOWO2_12_FULL_40_28]